MMLQELLFTLFALSDVVSSSLISGFKVVNDGVTYKLQQGDKLQDMKAKGKDVLLFSFEKSTEEENIQQNFVLTCGKSSNYFDVTCTGKSCQAKIPGNKVYSENQVTKCSIKLLLVPSDTESKPLNWEIANVVYDKLSKSPVYKKSPDQKEDFFDLLEELKPSFAHEKIPDVTISHYIFIGLLLASWAVFPLLFHAKPGKDQISFFNVIKANLNTFKRVVFWLCMVGFVGFTVSSWYYLDIVMVLKGLPIVLPALAAAGFFALRELYIMNIRKSGLKSE